MYLLSAIQGQEILAAYCTLEMIFVQNKAGEDLLERAERLWKKESYKADLDC